MTIELKTYNEILGKMIRKMVADSPVNDFNQGSVLLTLLEAIATSDFDNNASILSVLETLNIDALKNSDLDSRAADYGLSRKIATKATGFVRISDSSISKQVTSLYAIKSAPISGNSVIFVNDASGWSLTGTLFVGRGTSRFEGPISYTDIENNGSFYTITLGESLRNDHLLSDTVINSQGKSDVIITQGTRVIVPANNRTPEIGFKVVRSTVLSAGETSVDDVEIISENTGTLSNVGINTIVRFSTPPFSSAAVSNTSSTVNGADLESDDDLRERIKSYSATLSRGTRVAILASVLGVSDTTDGKQVASATIVESASKDESSTLYIDDGIGFQPSYTGQDVDVLVPCAHGGEIFLQLSNFPVPRPQVVNGSEDVIEMVDGCILNVMVDDAEDSIVFTSSQFKNIKATSTIEIVAAINSGASLLRCRLANNSKNILIYPVDVNAEKIQVLPKSSSISDLLYANNYLKFPIVEQRDIYLYKNNILLNERTSAAVVSTMPIDDWGNLIQGNLIVKVDSTPAQDRSIASSDFNKSMSELTIEDWIIVFNSKYAGITTTSTEDGRILFSSNKLGVGSSIEIVGGSLMPILFYQQVVSDTGTSSEFVFNRQTGNIQLNEPLVAGDVVSAGAKNTRAQIISNGTTNGYYNLSIDSVGSKAKAVIVLDAIGFSIRPSSLVVGSNITIQKIDDKMRILSNISSTFLDVQVDDYIHLLSKSTWLHPNNTGLFKVISKGQHLVSGVDTYIEVININAVSEGPISSITGEEMKVFFSSSYPQIWSADLLPNPASSSLNDIRSSIDKNIINAGAEITKTNAIKVSTTTEGDGGIAIPISVGNMADLLNPSSENTSGTISHIANIRSSKDMLSWFTPTTMSVLFGSATYSGLVGFVITSCTPSNSSFGEELFTDLTPQYGDIFYAYSGTNKTQRKSIYEIPVDTFKTTLSRPNSIFDYRTGDSIGLAMPLYISSDDSIVFIFDNDYVNKTINVNMWRKGRINNTSAPSNISFSALDMDSSNNIDFSDLPTWSKDQLGTEFRDYAVWMRSRNWYKIGGQNSSGEGTLLVRSREYGPNGDKHRFSIKYPTSPSTNMLISQSNFPENTLTTVNLGSGPDKNYTIIGGTSFMVKSMGSDIWRLTFKQPYVDLSGVENDDLISIYDLNVSEDNRGTWKITNVDSVGRFLDILSLVSLSETSVGSKEVSEISTSMVNAAALGGKYFKLFDLDGSVAVWFNVDSSNVMPAHGCLRAIEIPLDGGWDNLQVAAKITTIINDDPAHKFVATDIGLCVVTIGDVDNGERQDISAMNSGLSVGVTNQGIDDGVETINLSSGLSIFSMVDNTVSNVSNKINSDSNLLMSTVIDGEGEKIITSTEDEENSVSFNHAAGLDYISLFDGQNYVKAFNNTNPNFILKSSLLLSDVVSYYNMATCPNTDITETGEVFKLLPRTSENVVHHLSHKALSQINLVGSVDFVERTNKIQVKSNTVGSSGGVEVIGGNANIADLSIVGDAISTIYNSKEYIDIKTSAYPSTINTGDIVRVHNKNAAKRNTSFSSNTSIDILPTPNNNARYLVNHKNTNSIVTPSTSWGIHDISSTYGLTSCIWEWIHDGTVNLTDVSIGDTLYAWNLPWSANNQSATNSYGELIGFRVVDVDISNNKVVVINPRGEEMTGTAIDTGSIMFSSSIITQYLLNHTTSTSYRLEKLGFLDLCILTRVMGPSPRFISSGARIDDTMVLRGTTFKEANRGYFRILGLTEDIIIFKNGEAIEEIRFSETTATISWTSGSNTITSSGSFNSSMVGKWIKKVGEDNSNLISISQYIDSSTLILGRSVSGISEQIAGEIIDQVEDALYGVYIKNIDDICIIGNDSAIAGDKLVVENYTDIGWPSTLNSGTFTVGEVGVDLSTKRQYIEINNAYAQLENNRVLGNKYYGLYLLEGDFEKFESIRLVTHSAINSINNSNRDLHLLPATSANKMSESYGTAIESLGKVGFDLGLSSGTDGYSYYIGLLRTVQRIVDGYEPDSASFPGQRAAGSNIEVLPPLMKSFSISMNVTTKNGINVSDISNNIKSVVIRYVISLGVGEDIIISEVISKVMGVGGVEAVVITNPTPSTERISVADDQKAMITSDLISIS